MNSNESFVINCLRMIPFILTYTYSIVTQQMYPSCNSDKTTVYVFCNLWSIVKVIMMMKYNPTYYCIHAIIILQRVMKWYLTDVE